MSLIKLNPTTPSQRFRKLQKNPELSSNKPEKSLVKRTNPSKGRNNYGRITIRRRGGCHKRIYRIIDFKRDKLDKEGIVLRLEYDPNRSTNIALVKYEDSEKRYIIAPKGLKVGNVVLSTNSPQKELKIGLAMPLVNMPSSTIIHNIELYPGLGGIIARSAGQNAKLISVDDRYATVNLPSGEIRLFSSKCRATIGRTSNEEHRDENIGKAGRNRRKGIRPRVRGIAMNPVDHPNGGGEGRSKSGGGRQHLVSPWGNQCKGVKTRNKNTNNLILITRKGKRNKK